MKYIFNKIFDVNDSFVLFINYVKKIKKDFIIDFTERKEFNSLQETLSYLEFYRVPIEYVKSKAYLNYYSDKNVIDTITLKKEQFRDKKDNLLKEVRKLYKEIGNDYILDIVPIERTVNMFYINLNHKNLAVTLNNDLEISKKKFESVYLDNMVTIDFIDYIYKTSKSKRILISLDDEFVVLYVIDRFILQKEIVTTIKDLKNNPKIIDYLNNYQEEILIEGSFEDYVKFSSELKINKTELIDNKHQYYNFTIRKMLYGSKI